MKTTKENVTDDEYKFITKVGQITIATVGIVCFILGYVAGKSAE